MKMKKKRLFSLLAAVWMAVAGAVAQTPAIESVTHTPEEAAGTVNITYGTDGTTLTPGETLLTDVKGKKVTVAVTPQPGYRVVGVTLENVAAAADDEPALDMTRTPLTLKVTKAGNLAFYGNSAINNLKYTVNGGEEQSATKGGTISLQVGDVVAFYCNGTQEKVGNDEIFAESNTTIEAQVYGNVMSLLDGTNFAAATAVGEYAFLYLFYDDAFLSNHLTNDLVLPATTLAKSCYDYMFYNCTGLTRTPKLPATTLGQRCYCQMFNGCTGLTDAYVAAPYTNSSNQEMDGMFTYITADQCTMHTTTAEDKAAWEASGFSFKDVVADYGSDATTGGESADGISAASEDGTTGTYKDANGVEREGIVVTLGGKKYLIATANETSGTPTWTVNGVAYYNFDDAKSQFANNTDSYSAANVWRLPTKDELTALVGLTSKGWDGTNKGYNWTIGSASLFLPAAGVYRSDGNAMSVGVDGGYWSSTPNGEEYASVLGVSSGYCIVTDGDPTRGFTVRLFCQLPSE